MVIGLEIALAVSLHHQVVYYRIVLKNPPLKSSIYLWEWGYNNCLRGVIIKEQ